MRFIIGFIMLFSVVSTTHAHHTEDDPNPYKIYSIDVALDFLEDLYISKIEKLYSEQFHYHDTVPENERDIILTALNKLSQVQEAIQRDQCRGPAVGVPINVSGVVSYKHLVSGAVENNFPQGMQIFSVNENGTRITPQAGGSVRISILTPTGSLKVKNIGNSQVSTYTGAGVAVLSNPNVYDITYTQ